MKRTKISISNDQALELFSSDSYLTVNKRLLNHYGPEVAVFLSNLVDKYLYFQHNNKLTDDWFFLIHKQQMEQTGLTETKLRRCKEILRNDRIIRTKMVGRPAKEKYKLELQNLIKTLEFKTSQNLRARPRKTLGLIKEPINKDKKINKKDFLNINNYISKEWQNHKPLQDILEEFTLHRTQIKKPLTPLACKRLMTKLKQYPISTVIQALEKSIENGWAGVFPESIKSDQEDSPTKLPKEIIYNYFTPKKNKGYAKMFYDGPFTEAENLLIDHSNGQSSELARNMVKLFDWINNTQTEKALERKEVPDAISLVKGYVDWLRREGWMEVEPRLFKHDNTIFKKKYLAWESREVGISVLTGKFFK